MVQGWPGGLCNGETGARPIHSRPYLVLENVPECLCQCVPDTPGLPAAVHQPSRGGSGSGIELQEQLLEQALT